MNQEKLDFVFVPALLGNQIGMGATAVIYEYSNDKIIKVFTRTSSKDEVKREYMFSCAVEQTGLPVPKNYGICKVEGTGDSKIDGHYGIIQEKIIGISVMNYIMSTPDINNEMEEIIKEVVGLQVKINRINASGLGLRNQRQSLQYGIKMAPLLTEDEKESLLLLLESLPAEDKLCHSDYHFDNIFMTSHGLVCFDWCDAACGNPVADLARSLLIFEAEALPVSIPKEVVELIKRFRSTSKGLYLKSYEALGGTYDHLEEWMAVVAASRLFCEVKENKPAMLRIVKSYLDTTGYKNK